MQGAVSASDGTLVPTGVQLGLGVRPASVAVNFQQGTIMGTGGTLDLAIEGQGFIEVTLPSGQVAFTRDGALKRTGDGLIVTNDGYEVTPGITIPEDARTVEINADGEVYAYFLDQIQPTLLGQFTLANFSNPRGLGGNRFEPLCRNRRLGPGHCSQPWTGRPRDNPARVY